MSRGEHGPFITGTYSKGQSVECPRCHAVRGDRCYRLTSWVVDETRPGGGFYTERSVRPHVERRPEAAPVVVPDAKPSRGALRQQISKLAYKKLNGRDRITVGRWAALSIRTNDELAAKVAELEATPAVPR